MPWAWAGRPGPSPSLLLPPCPQALSRGLRLLPLLLHPLLTPVLPGAPPPARGPLPQHQTPLLQHVRAPPGCTLPTNCCLLHLPLSPLLLPRLLWACRPHGSSGIPPTTRASGCLPLRHLLPDWYSYLISQCSAWRSARCLPDLWAAWGHMLGTACPPQSLAREAQLFAWGSNPQSGNNRAPWDDHTGRFTRSHRESLHAWLSSWRQWGSVSLTGVSAVTPP